MKKGRLTPPRGPSLRRQYWLRTEIEALGGKPPPLGDDKNMLSRSEAAVRLGVCVETISRMHARHKLRGERRNGRLYFDEERIARLEAQQDFHTPICLAAAAELTGLTSRDIIVLMATGAFPQRLYRTHFRQGDVQAWFDTYKRTGSPTGNADDDKRHYPQLIRAPATHERGAGQQ